MAADEKDSEDIFKAADAVTGLIGALTERLNRQADSLDKFIQARTGENREADHDDR